MGICPNCGSWVDDGDICNSCGGSGSYDDEEEEKKSVYIPPKESTLHNEAFELFLIGEYQDASQVIYNSIMNHWRNGDYSSYSLSRDFALKGIIHHKQALKNESVEFLITVNAYNVSIEAFNNSLKINDSGIVKNHKALCLFNYAWFFIHCGVRYEECMDLIDEALLLYLEKDLDYAGALNCKAVIFNKMNRLDEAVEYYKEALKYDPSNEIYRENMENLERGIDEKYR